MNPQEFGKQIATMVRGAIARALDTVNTQLGEVTQRLKALEDRPAPAAGKDGAPGQDGRDGRDAPAPTVELVREALMQSAELPELLEASVAKHLEAHPVPAGRDGAPGQDAPAPTVEQIRTAVLEAPTLPALLDALVAKHLEANPVPAGKDGAPGRDGKDGAPGQDAPAPTAELVAEALHSAPALVADAVAAHLEANPPAAGKDGAPGRDGQDAPAPTAETVAAALAAQPDILAAAVTAYMQEHPVRDGKDADPEFVRQVAQEYMEAHPAPAGQDGAPGAPGKDGTSVALEDVVRHLDSMQATWALDFERRAMDLFQKALDRLPTPKDGRDGLGFEDMQVEYDGARSLKLVFVRGEQRKEFPLRVPAIIHRGVYNKDTDYEDGDAATWGGSMWLAQCATKGEQPGTGKSWRLVVKRGNDAKSPGR